MEIDEHLKYTLYVSATDLRPHQLLTSAQLTI
jgi:hypothetical protein